VSCGVLWSDCAEKPDSVNCKASYQLCSDPETEYNNYTASAVELNKIVTKNYKNEDVTYNTDGSITTIGLDFVRFDQPDGSSETTFNSGVIYQVDADGTTREYLTNNSVAITYPDGTVEVIDNAPPPVNDDPIDDTPVTVGENDNGDTPAIGDGSDSLDFDMDLLAIIGGGVLALIIIIVAVCALKGRGSSSNAQGGKPSTEPKDEES